MAAHKKKCLEPTTVVSHHPHRLLLLVHLPQPHPALVLHLHQYQHLEHLWPRLHQHLHLVRRRNHHTQKSKEKKMLDIILWIAVGAFVGWNFPQPFWARAIQAKIQAMVRGVK
jgi:hypothetical protein